MPSITAMPHPILMARNDPFALLLNTVCATTPTPNAIRIKVPKNSAAASRAVPLSMRGILDAFVLCYLLFYGHHENVLPGQHFDHPIQRKPLRLHLLLHLGDAHLVHFEDRHARILLA